MGQNRKKTRHRQYRLNGKKLAGTLLMLAFIAAVAIVVVMAMEHATDGAAAAQNSQSSMADKLLVSPEGTVTALAAATATPSASPVETTQSSQTPGAGLEGRLIVVDAGHGGFDPGAIGVSGVHEDKLNLAVAKCLQDELEDHGVRVVMTREDDSAIGADKTADMAERKRIIEESGSDIVISIHMNSFENDPGVSGPLVLYMTGSQRGEQLAQAVVGGLNAALGTEGKTQARDNLIVLKSGNQPCVLVECGYLSNTEEESRLQQADYQKKLAQAICDGAEDFFEGQ